MVAAAELVFLLSGTSKQRNMDEKKQRKHREKEKKPQNSGKKLLCAPCACRGAASYRGPHCVTLSASAPFPVWQLQIILK